MLGSKWFVLAMLEVQLLCACAGSTATQASTEAPTAASSATAKQLEDHADTRRFLAALVAGTIERPDDPLLVGLDLWRDLCAADSSLCSRGTRVEALVPGPDGAPQLDPQGEPKSVEISRIVADEARVALAASSATREFARRFAAGKFRAATPAERQIVMERTPSEVPTDITIDVVEAPPSTIAFASWDGHVFWIDELTPRATQDHSAL